MEIWNWIAAIAGVLILVALVPNVVRLAAGRIGRIEFFDFLMLASVLLAGAASHALPHGPTEELVSKYFWILWIVYFGLWLIVLKPLLQRRYPAASNDRARAADHS